jgi:hypothetical protein
VDAPQAASLAALVQEQWRGRLESRPGFATQHGAPMATSDTPGAYWPLGADAPAVVGDGRPGLELIDVKSVGVSLLVGFTLDDSPSREYLLHFDLTEMPVQLDAAANSIYEALFLIADPARWEQDKGALVDLSPRVALLPVGKM